MSLRFRFSTKFSLALLLLASPAWSRAETVTFATYNIELFHEHFVPSSQPVEDPDVKERLKKDADKDLWEISQVILDPAFSPDVLIMEECCEQDELEKFNKQWLKGAYETVNVFPTNTERHQTVALMMKPGFKILEKHDQYYLEKDPAGGNERGDRLFARGPAFCKIQTPGGAVLWVGGTHQKSKHGNSLEVAKWRLRESQRLHAIAMECINAGPKDLVLLGDMNDELGEQEFEHEAGGDAVAAIVGPASDGLILATKPLIDAGKISFGGYWNPHYRAFIDQIILSPSLKNDVQMIDVFHDSMAPVASDHYPVYIKLNLSPSPTTQAAP